MSEPNVLFPGRPDYVGPTKGLFGLLHHDRLFEWSYNVMERVAYVKGRKPPAEIPTRLHCMIALPFDGAWYADYKAKLAALYADYDPVYADYAAKLDPVYADCEAKLAVLMAEAFILQHIPDCPWNGHTLFPEEK